MNETKVDGISLMRNEGLPNGGFEKYPSMVELRASIAELHGVSTDQVILGSGITGVFTTVCNYVRSKFDTIDYIPNTYSGLVRVMDLAGIGKDHSSRVQLTVSPSNPEGVVTIPYNNPNKRIQIFDEAYVEYLCIQESAIDLIRNGWSGIIAMRTFSKARCLASIRVGYAVVSRDISKELRNYEGNYVLSNSSASIALDSIRNDSLTDTATDVEITSNMVTVSLREKGYHVRTQCANFIVADVPKVEGFSVRSLDDYEGYDGYNRITISSMEIMKSYLNKLEKKQ